MTGAVFVIAINIAISITMAIAFFAVGYFDTKNRAANWFGVAFILAMLSFAGEYILFAGLSDAGARMFIAVSMLGCFLVIVYALGSRYEIEMPIAGLSAILIASAVLYFLILDLPRQDVTRQVLYQAPYVLVTLLGTFIVLRSYRRALQDRLLAIVLVLVALSFVSKPVVAYLTGGVGEAGRDYGTTLYALVSQASGAVAALLMAIILLAIVISDSVTSLIKRSERDAPTGLLNQQGFQEHGLRLLANTAHKNQRDMALVLFSLSLPHSIEVNPDPEFAEALFSIFGPEALVARLWDMNFAAIVPNTNLFSARRQAEMLRARAGAGTLSLDSVARASVGIAELEAGESLSEVLGRAQWAHQEAVQAGGDCIRLAARSAFNFAREA